MKFICPKCKKDTEIEVVMTDCIVTETICRSHDII